MLRHKLRPLVVLAVASALSVGVDRRTFTCATLGLGVGPAWIRPARSQDDVAAPAAEVAPAAPAAPDEAAAVALPPLERYRDPEGLFSLELPAGYFKIRRTIEGDIIRRGNAIFSGGDLSKSEIVSLEKYPAASLLAGSGLGALIPKGGAVTAWSELGAPLTVAKMIAERRDDVAGEQQKIKGPSPAQTSVVDASTVVGSGGRIDFEIQSTIRDKDGLVVTKRTQRARAELQPNGELLCLWVSCPDADWQRSEAPLLRRISSSLEVLK